MQLAVFFLNMWSTFYLNLFHGRYECQFSIILFLLVVDFL